MFFLLIFLSVFLIGCQQKTQDVVCNEPYILVGTDCCLDEDGNKICDKDEMSDSSVEDTTTEKIKENVAIVDTSDFPINSLNVKNLGIGDTATDGKMEITLKNVRYSNKIPETTDKEYFTIYAPEDKQFVIVDILAENIMTDEVILINVVESTIIDSEGYTYILDIMNIGRLDHYLIGGEILPGTKQRGELVYLLPKESEGLKFTFKLEHLVGVTKIFELD